MSPPTEAQQLQSAYSILALLWGIAVSVVGYNIAADLVEILKSRKKKKQEKDRRYKEPCAVDMHEWGGDPAVCQRCQEPKPPGA
jgi:hypothetical protein